MMKTFCDWVNLQESNLIDLHNSAVEAFPNTTKRQHATQPIKIIKVDWTPFVGMKTLFVKGLAQNEGREYNTLILFKNIKYLKEQSKNTVSVSATDGRKVIIEKIALDDHDVVVRCNCKDFHWRFNYFDHLDKSLYGRKRSPYKAKYNPDSANPMKMPGMCKHLMKFVKILDHSGIII